MSAATVAGRWAGLEDSVLTAIADEASADATLDGVAVERLLRHLSGRRATFAAVQEGRPVVVKVFSSPRARGNDRRLALLHRAGVEGLVPRSLAVGASGHVGVLDFTPGEVLDTVDAEMLVSHARAVGEALARLHGSGAELDRAWTWTDETEQLLRRCPESCLAHAEDAVGRAVTDRTLVPSHRDFHPRQVVLTGDGEVRLIDLDDAAMAPAGLDVGNMVAHLRRETVLGRHPREVTDAAVEAFLAGYGDRPADLDVWEQVAVARLAGLAETRHRDVAQRDALLALLPVPGPRRVTSVDTGHADRPVQVEDQVRDGVTRRVVVKRYLTADGAQVHDDMQALWASTFGRSRAPLPGMPEPLAYDVARAALTMTHVEGPAFAVRGDLGLALDRAEEAADLLADLHLSGVVVGRRRSRERLLRSSARKVASRRDHPAYPEFAAVLETAGEVAASLPDESRLVPSHGDYSPRNLLASPGGAVLIDFDRLQQAAPARDVAYWCAWVWVTATLAGADGDAWELTAPFVERYRARCGDEGLDGPSTDFHRALGLVRIAHGWSSLLDDGPAARRVLGEAARVLQQCRVGHADGSERDLRASLAWTMH